MDENRVFCGSLNIEGPTHFSDRIAGDSNTPGETNKRCMQIPIGGWDYGQQVTEAKVL